MSYLITVFLTFILTLLLTPLILFIRARRDERIDASFFGVMYLVMAYCTIHLFKLSQLRDQDGNRPLWWVADKNRPGMNDLFKDILGKKV